MIPVTIELNPYSIQIASQITLGEIITIGIISILIPIIFWIWRRSLPMRAYSITFLDMPKDFPPSYAKSQHYLKKASGRAGNDGLATIYTRVLANHGVDVHEISFRLVKKAWFSKLPLWGWEAATPSEDGVFVTNIWDADWEQQRQINPYRIDRGQPLSELNSEGGYCLKFGKEMHLLANDSLWVRVIIDVRSNWDGYIEFQGASPDNRRAYKRRKITLQK